MPVQKIEVSKSLAVVHACVSYGCGEDRIISPTIFKEQSNKDINQ